MKVNVVWEAVFVDYFTVLVENYFTMLLNFIHWIEDTPVNL